MRRSLQVALASLTGCAAMSTACMRSPDDPALKATARSALSASAQLKLVKTIPVGAEPVRVVLSADEATAYVTNINGASVSAVDLVNGVEAAVFPVAASPGALALAPTGHTLYVGQSGGGVSVIDLPSGTVTSIDTGGGPIRDLLIPPGASRIYLAMEFSGLRAIDLATGAVSTVSTFACPEGLAATPDGSRLFVNYQCGGPSGSSGHDAIGIFDPATGTFLGSITGLANVGQGIVTDGNVILAQGGDACIQPFYDHVGCPAEGTGIVNIVDVPSLSKIDALPLSGYFAIAPGRAFILMADGAAFRMLDYQTHATVQSLPIAASGSAAFAAGGKRIIAPVISDNSLAVIDFLDVGSPDGGSAADASDAGGAGAALGQPCAADGECASGSCVDSVCCATACGGGNPGDCQACSVAAGGSADGTCTILPTSRVC